MDSNVHLGDGLFDEAADDINIRLKGIIRLCVDVIFNYIEDKVKELPDTIKRLRNSPEVEQEIVTLWSEHLTKNGLVPDYYNGLPDELLISNFHQDGYLGGLHVGYALAMMALVDNDAPKDMIIAVRDYIYPNLLGHHYDNRDEFINQYKDERYKWIDNTK